MVCLWERREKGKDAGRVWGGVGTGKGTGKSMRTHLSKLPFSKLSFSFSPTQAVLSHNIYDLDGVTPNPEKLKVTQKVTIRGCEKGLAGWGWRQMGANIQRKMIPRIARQPLFETSETIRSPKSSKWLKKVTWKRPQKSFVSHFECFGAWGFLGVTRIITHKMFD